MEKTVDASTFKLHNGDRVGIVGGGPAGSFFAMHLLKYAAAENLSLTVTIFEYRDFGQSGPAGCAKCAGLLSAGLQSNLRRFGLALPPEVVQSKADSYVLHLAAQEVEIFPPLPHREIVSVYRGSGPRAAVARPSINFDYWLLQQAEKAGATIVKAMVKNITFTPTNVTVSTNFEHHPFELVVLATGVNGRRVAVAGDTYQPPETAQMIQDELGQYPGNNRRVHVHFGRKHGVVFGATVPKGAYVNVSLLAKNPSLKTIADFLTEAGIPDDYRRLCGCKPHIPVSAAKKFYGDRFVAVGDAAASRLYKDGIGSAFHTAEKAAHTAIFHGIAAADFKKQYAPLCRRIARDNFWGKFLFLLWEITGNSRALTRLWLLALTTKSTHPFEAKICRLALWNMFTGDDSYEHILRSLLHPRVVWFLLSHIWGVWRRPTVPHSTPTRK